MKQWPFLRVVNRIEHGFGQVVSDELAAATANAWHKRAHPGRRGQGLFTVTAPPLEAPAATGHQAEMTRYRVQAVDAADRSDGDCQEFAPGCSAQSR
jgi:hypothetical protein